MTTDITQLESRAEQVSAKADEVYRAWKGAVVSAALLEADWERLNEEEIRLRQAVYAAKRMRADLTPRMTAEESNGFPQRFA